MIDWPTAVVSALTGGTITGAVGEYIKRRVPSSDVQRDFDFKLRAAEDQRYKDQNVAADEFRKELREEMKELRIQHKDCETNLAAALKEQNELFKRLTLMEVTVMELTKSGKAIKPRHR